MRRVLAWLMLALGLAVIAAAAFLWWASGGETDTRDVAPGEVVNAPGVTPPAPPRELRVVTFNIGYGRGPAGDYSGPWSEAEIKGHLDGIAAQLAALEADIVALQEVDLDAARSHGIDEGAYLQDKLGMAARTCVVTWQNNYIPFPYWPPSKHYGRMKSGQCVLSRWPIASSTRYRLPQPDEQPFWKNAFYLHRAIDHVEVTLAAGHTLHVYNVHLEAFNARNRQAQADALAALVAQNPSPDVLVLGDFNAPPPGAKVLRGFADEPEIDFTGDDTVARLGKSGLSDVLGLRDIYTHPADAPTRRLDYIFHGPGLAVEEAHVITQPPVQSDHLPVFARLRVLDGPTGQAPAPSAPN